VVLLAVVYVVVRYRPRPDPLNALDQPSTLRGRPGVGPRVTSRLAQSPNALQWQINAAPVMSDPDAILPDRITVLTCLGCGAMGREARCEGDCSEHKLLLVDAGDFDALQSAAQLAHQRSAALKPIARALLDSHPSEQACTDAYRALRAAAHKALEATKPYDDRGDWQAPPPQTGWWCAQCGNVDAPRPCIGVCVWHQTEWVNLTLYQAGLNRAAEDFRAAPEMRRILARLVAVTPHAGRCQDNWRALQAQARAALERPELRQVGTRAASSTKASKRRTTHRT
jgi:hypothetical protein